MSDLIPTGRTSLVKRGGLSLQVQTEYANRPYPRITTAVQQSGQVVQKIERNLDQPVTTVEEKNLVEAQIRRQHAEVLAIIDHGPEAFVAAMPVATPEKPAPATVEERLLRIPGRHRLFRLDNEGNFVDADLSTEFKRNFAAVFKSLRELIEIFIQVPGAGLTRESGVYEIERNALYLLSTGTEMYVFHIEHPDYLIDYEKALSAALAAL